MYTARPFIFKKNATAASYCVVLETTLEPVKRPGVFGLRSPLFRVDCYEEMLTADTVVRVKTIFREVKEQSDSSDGTIFYISEKIKAGQSSPSLYFSVVKVVA